MANEDKNLGGRPSVMTQETINKLEQAFAMGCSDREACLFADISTQPLYDYQIEHPEFAERKKLLKSKPIMLARQTVIKAVAGSPAVYDKDRNLIREEVKADPDLAFRYLERKARDEFATRVETTGRDGESLASIDVENAVKRIMALTPEQKAARLEEIKKNGEQS